MRKLMMAAVVLAIVTPDVYALESVTIVVGETRRDIGIDSPNMPVCALKKKVARLVGLELNKFELMSQGFALREGFSLREDNVTDQSVLVVRPIEFTFQCS